MGCSSCGQSYRRKRQLAADLSNVPPAATPPLQTLPGPSARVFRSWVQGPPHGFVITNAPPKPPKKE